MPSSMDNSQISTEEAAYAERIRGEMLAWRKSMLRKPSLWSRSTGALQKGVERLIPEKVHKVITAAIKQMTRTVVYGTEFATPAGDPGLSPAARESKVRKRIQFYRLAAATEGAVTGAGGFWLSLADFPLWMTLKMKMLFDIAGLYGFDVHDYKERIFLLYIFQLTFSSPGERVKTYECIRDWETFKETIPADINDFDWRTFQLEYRNYIDLAKLAQMIPGVGAVAGFLVNQRLTRKLGRNAMNAFRMRRFPESAKTPEVGGTP